MFEVNYATAIIGADVADMFNFLTGFARPGQYRRVLVAPNHLRDAILGEIEALVSQGVLEITLLGQNVNAYGSEFGDREAFAKLLRACGDIQGLERVRFTSPHPADFTDDVIAAMAETPSVMPQRMLKSAPRRASKRPWRNQPRRPGKGTGYCTRSWRVARMGEPLAGAEARPERSGRLPSNLRV